MWFLASKIKNLNSPLMGSRGSACDSDDQSTRQAEGHSSNILQDCDSQFVRESMGKREHSYTVGGNVNWYNHYGK